MIILSIVAAVCKTIKKTPHKLGKPFVYRPNFQKELMVLSIKGYEHPVVMSAFKIDVCPEAVEQAMLDNQKKEAGNRMRRSMKI